MIVYRIAKAQYASDIGGIGAAMYPGRWNKKGTAVLYTSETPEISLLENLVHLPFGLIPDVDLLTIELPDSVTELKPSDLPSNWQRYPAPTILSEIGQQWVNEGKTVALKVPSCIVDTACNFILNCHHDDYVKKVKVLEQRTFKVDSRLNS